MLVIAPSAQASFHLIKVREVFPGSTAHPNSSYVELQMYAAGENLVSNGNLEVFSSTGSVLNTYTPTANVTHSANQSTVLIADSEYSSQFPSGPAPDFVNSSLNLSPAGGAVCWPQTEPPFDDCASWGNFTGQGSLASTDTAPADPSGIPDGMAIRRSIAGGVCSTLLEDADDTNNSSVDFATATPVPRDNASAVTESECHAPTVVIDSAIPAENEKTQTGSATFNFHSSPAGAEKFECKLDAGAFADCTSGTVTYPSLAEGAHSFSVKATSAGQTGVPTTRSWTVDQTAPTTTIDAPKPANPNSGSGLVFKFHASETGATFKCSLVKEGEADAFSVCSSGKTYPKQLTATYVFKAMATDQAGNVGTPDSYTFVVDNSLADTEPPETTIKTHPVDPTESTTASFTYESSEAGSTFECALDGAPFAACLEAGVTYSGLAVGPHTFQVRATDASKNTDKSPAGFSFTVVSPPPPEEKGHVEEQKPPPPPPAVLPDTMISAKPPAKTHDRTPTVRFKATVAGATFQCKVDGGPYKSCRSPLTTKSLSFGRHTVKVRAIANGQTDPTPATATFKVTKG